MTKVYSEKLRDIRTYFGYSQREVAEAIGVKRNLYTEWEIYRTIIPLKHLVSLANFYKFNIDYLLGLTEQQKSIDNIKFDIDKACLRLKEIRAELKLSVRDFAKELKVSKSTISRYEKGTTIVSTSVCYNSARKYNISVDYIIGATNQKYIIKAS